MVIYHLLAKQNVQKLNKTSEYKYSNLVVVNFFISVTSLELPGILTDQKVTIKTDVVTSDIPYHF